MKRTSGIHLVSPSRTAVVERPARMARVSARDRAKMGSVALAGAALIGPVAWIGHALLACLRRR